MTHNNTNKRVTARREFLKGGTAAVAAAGLVSSTPGLSIARSAWAGGSDSVKVGLIGCGGRGKGAAADAMRASTGSVQLIAVADVFEENVNAAVEQLRVDHGDKVQVRDSNRFVGFDAYQRVIDSDDVDLVILTTPPGFRPLHFEKAVQAGKHVFMEKPVAVDAPGVRRILAANRIAREKELLVQVGLQRRHERAYRETIQRLRDGAIGDINLLRCYWNGGGVWDRPRREGDTELKYQMRNWYYFNWLCGDHINEQHIHNIDVCNWLMDGYPVTAQGQGGRQVRTGLNFGQIYDHHVVEFTYEDGTKMFSQCRHIRNTWNSVSEHAHVSDGYCNISEAKIVNAGMTAWEYGRGGRGGHQQEHHDLFADLADGRRPNEGDYGALSTLTAIMGRMATYSGKEITWEQALNSELSLADVDAMTSFDDAAPLQPDAEGRYPVPMPGESWEDVL
jgi:predicted dehydrogenase